MNVLLLSGGSAKHRFSEDIIYKSLAPICGKPMVRWVTEALRQSDRIGQIYVLGPKAELEAALSGIDGVTVDEGEEELFANIEKGVRFFTHEEQVMVATADIPMITGEIIDWMADTFAAMPEDFIYSIITKEATVARFPGMKRTYVKVREGEFTGGNICCVRPGPALEHIDALENMINNRKRPDKLAALFGMKMLMGLVTGRVKIADIEKRGERIFQIRCKALNCPYPEVGSDVDKSEDIPSAEQELRSR